jgi:putative membrane protein
MPGVPKSVHLTAFTLLSIAAGELNVKSHERKRMINRYTDHAANERTYLAWIRTSIAIMAFGFLIEKFEFFLSSFDNKINGTYHFNASESAEQIAFGFFLAGIAIIFASTIRFFLQKKAIEAEKVVSYSSKTADVLLSIIMLCLGLFVAFYLWHMVLTN